MMVRQPEAVGDNDAAATPGPMRVAYIVSRFPKVTETFVLFEMQAMERLGLQIEFFPLLREREPVMHPEAERWTHRAHYMPFLSFPILWAQLWFLGRSPRRYVVMWWEVLRRTWGSTNFFVGALGIVPKSVRFAYEMRRLGIEHVHAHFASHPAVAAFVVRRLTGIPYSFTAHGADLHVDRHMLREKLQEAAFAVPISDYNRELMVAECGESLRDRTRVVHCGVDLEVFVPRAANRTPAPRFQILCVARLETVKGHRYLIEACRILAEHSWDFECHLIGDGPRRQDIEAQIETAGLGDRVLLHGPRTRDEIVQWMAAADVLVLPSAPTRSGRREGIPVVLMEAMASELPVVSTATSGIPELVDDGVSGLLVAPEDALALAAALERLVASPDLRQALGRAGRARVARDFDLHRNAAELAALFSTLGTKEPAAHSNVVGAGV